MTSADTLVIMNVDKNSREYKAFLRWQQKIHKHLLDLRHEHEYTQVDMVGSGMSQRSYERMEQNPEQISTLYQVFRLAKFYGITVSELLDVE